MSAKGLLKTVARGISKQSPAIFTGLAVSGVVTTVVFMHKSTLIAHEILEEAEKKGERPEELTGLIKLTWRAYLPTAMMGLATITCIISAASIYKHRNTALAGAYLLTETALKRYQEKVIQTIGKKKEQQVRDDISKDNIKQNPPHEGNIIITGKGDHLCYDPLSGRYFRSDIESIRQAVNELNHNLLTDMWLPLNDLYYELGLANIDLGNTLGWSSERLLEVHYVSKLTDIGEPCIVLQYEARPDIKENCDHCFPIPRG